MPIFVHLAHANVVARIRRSGIRRGDRGVFCLPTLPDYSASHQWARELKRGGQRTLVAVYFWLEAGEPVSVGRYNEPHLSRTAGEAVKVLMAVPDPRGYEVIVPRAIGRSELRKVRPAPRGLGWRYLPGAHLRRPCLCDWCCRGEIKIRRRRAYDAQRHPFPARSPN